MPITKVGDINMYYEVHGQGEPLVMVCGASSTAESFALLAPRYAKEYKAITFDNRGIGRTDAPDFPYTMAMLANDMAGLMDTLGISSAHIYGQSMGGMIAQQFAVSYPGKVKTLILQCTTCGGPHSIPLTDTKRFNPEIRPKMTPQDLGQETLHLCVTQGYIDNHPDVARILMSAMIKQAQPAHGALRQARAIDTHNTYDRLPEIKVPTLVLGAEFDGVIPVENSRIIASRIPGAELVIFNGCGHILIEAGDKPLRLILEFLKRAKS